MELTQVIGLAVDSGLCVLIWIVQLVVYPGFAYYSPEELKTWHSRYTWRITVIVFPLMTAQLVLGGMDIYYDMNWVSGVTAVLVGGTWASTFIQFVPLHNKLTLSSDPSGIVAKIVRKNWLRTCLWTAIFILSFVDFIGLVN
jgi:hypothetical protein